MSDLVIENVNQNKNDNMINYNVVYNELLESAKDYYRDDDYDKAFPLFYYLAINNNLDGLYFAGYMLENGLGVEQDYFKAFEFYKKASKSNDYDAKIRLAFLYDNGYGVKQDLDKAIELFCRNITDDVVEKLLEIADLYINGEDVEKNLDIAIDICSIVEDYDKSGEAKFKLALIYCDDDYTKEHRCDYDYKDFSDILLLCKESANLGYIPSQKFLFNHYLKFATSSQDLYELAKCYYYGLGTDVDYVKARECLEKSLFEENDNALYLLGCIYRDGLGVFKDNIKAVELFRKSALKYNVDAVNSLISMYKDGRCNKFDKFIADEMLRKIIIKNYKSFIPNKIDGIDLYDFGILKEMFDKFFDSFSSRERDVLALRFGFIDGKKHSLEDIGQHFGITRERIRQIEAKFLRRFRSCRINNYFESFLGIEEKTNKVYDFKFFLEEENK